MEEITIKLTAEQIETIQELLLDEGCGTETVRTEMEAVEGIDMESVDKLVEVIQNEDEPRRCLQWDHDHWKFVQCGPGQTPGTVVKDV